MSSLNETLRLILLAQGNAYFAPATPVGASDVIKSFTVPAGKQWQILGCHTRLTTDGTPGDRRLSLAIGSSNQILYQSRTIQAANLAYDYEFGVGQPAELVGTRVYVPIPPIFLPSGTEVLIQVANAQSSDTVSTGGSFLSVMERL